MNAREGKRTRAVFFGGKGDFTKRAKRETRLLTRVVIPFSLLYLTFLPKIFASIFSFPKNPTPLYEVPPFCALFIFLAAIE
jgi:4-amino-4-deoxy-L-arabinose transferase-like glycosyltransferase